MTRYAVSALTQTGQLRHFSTEAASEDAAALEAMCEGLTPISVVQRNGGWIDVLHRPLSFGNRLGAGDLALFCEQMEAMSASGLTVEQALKVISRQGGDRRATGMAKRLLPRIQGGLALSAALDAEPGLPPYLIGMVRAAENGGKLAEGLGEAGRYLRRQANTGRALSNALAYPVVVLLTVIAALILVLTVVIPGFAPIFAGEEHRLPRLTRVVLWLSGVATRHGIQAVLSAGAGILTVGAVLRRVPGLRLRVRRLFDRLPPVRLAMQLDVARMLGVMGLLFRSGLEVSEAVALAARAGASKRLRDRVEAASRRLREGASISTALAEVDAIPDDTRALVEVGEHTGDLGATTVRAAHLLEADTAYRIERLVALANPIAIAGLGAIVGLVVGGVMLGILSINQLALRS